MNRCILYCASIFFVLFVLEGNLGVEITRPTTPPHTTTPLHTDWSAGKRRYSKVKQFKLRQNEVSRLHGLRSDLAALLATYVSRETFKTTPKADWITNKILRRVSNISYPQRRTKITSKMYYPIKRTYPNHRERRYVMYRHFLSILSKKDKQKEEFLTDSKTRPKKGSFCYIDVHACFTEYCYTKYDYYWKIDGLKDMQNLLARACSADWLTPQKIMNTIRSLCCGKSFKFKLVNLT